MNHTKEPWSTPEYDNADCSNAEWWEIPGIGRIYKESDARRIVACVNACAEISTATLEQVGLDVGNELVKLKQQRDRFQKLEGRDLREMLRAMQNGEMTVSRGVELVDMWLAGNYTDEQLPPIREGLGEDEMPWDRIDSLTQQRDELQHQLAGMTDSAKHFSGGMEYYRDLIDEAAKSIGIAMYTADDQGVHPDPLRAKLPECVAELVQQRDELLAARIKELLAALELCKQHMAKDKWDALFIDGVVAKVKEQK